MSDEDARRKAMFARFARISMKTEEDKRQKYLKQLTETKEEDLQMDRWLTPRRKIKLDADNLAYAEPYRAEYTGAPSSSATSKTGSECGENLDCDDVKSTCSVVSSNGTRNGTRSGMRRGRAWATMAALSSRTTSVVDFERTSTIMPPTVVECNEYESSVEVDQIKQTYFKNFRQSSALPIHRQRQYIVNSINSYNVVIIEGSTGCGKTTQVPVYILEDAVLRRKQTKAPIIWVTQPRRIAAKSIADRVCQEHDWEIGSLVGYQIGLETKTTPDTCITYCTSGVLLQKLIHERSLVKYSHIIIDEAHERDADTDLLLMMIRNLMRKEQSYFRLIVMSATMDMAKLNNYFKFKADFGHNPVTTPAIVKIDGKEPNQIQIIYMDTLASTFRIHEKLPDFVMDEANLYSECINAAATIILEVIPRLDTFNGASESTLVFLPGLAEIMKLHEKLRPKENSYRIEIIPMHSCLPHSEQMRAFLPAKPGYRKVLLATNIAESSITVKDVGFIVDFCLNKTLRKDEITNFPTLKLHWSSKDKSIQRAGRTGRCCPGKVFRMVTQEFYKLLPDYTEPELLVAPLELSVLRVKKFNMGEIKALLAVVLDPPPYTDIQKAVLELKQIGALSSTYNGVISDIDGDITGLGTIISALPIDVHLSKMIVMAAVLDVLEDAIIIAACLSTNRTVVKHEYNDTFETYKRKLEWAKGSCSDLLLSLEVYKRYREYKKDEGKLKSFLSKWCNQEGLDERKLEEVDALLDDLKGRLKNENIEVFEQPNRIRDQCEDELMLKVAFCASFYPSYFLTQPKTEDDIRQIENALCGLDPTKTIILHNFPVNQVPLYKSQVMDTLSVNQVLDSDQVDFITEESRALLVFNTTNPMREDESSIQAIDREGIVHRPRALDTSVHYALKFGEKYGMLGVREYHEAVAMERMQWYREQRERLSQPGRLVPSRMKVVSGRPADNSALIQANADDYNAIMATNYHIEVEFDERQDSLDRHELRLLEQSEMIASSKPNKAPQTIKEIITEDVHPLFKRGQLQNGRRPIRGPTSPIQMSFVPVLQKSRGYMANVDHLSVNSILLNPDYTEPRRQMLVAATVYQKNNQVQARDTSLLPNIRGLPTIMSLLFAQYYRLVYNTKLSCISGAIFGLGWDEGDRPLDRQYEVELGFDVQITKDDIELINMGRENISTIIKYIKNQDAGLPRAKIQKQIRDIILALIRKRRFALEEDPIHEIDFHDGEFVKDKHNVPKQQLTPLECGQTRNFLPLMEVSRNYTELDYFKAVEKNLHQLNDILNCVVLPPVEGIRCYLCGRKYFFIKQSQIVSHMTGELHRGKMVEFERKLLQLRELQEEEQQQQQ